MTFIFLLFKKYLFYYFIYLLRISCLNAVFMSFPSIQRLLCVHPLQLLKFMVSYSSVIIVTYTCIHTLITMFCLIDFSVALYIYVFRANCLVLARSSQPWSTSGYGAQWWSSTQFCPQAFGGPSAFALSSYCFLLRQCFPISVTWWPSAVRHGPDISFPDPIFVLSEHSQHFISELYALLYWIVRSSALSLSLCPVSGQHLTQSGSTVNTCVNRWGKKLSGTVKHQLSIDVENIVYVFPQRGRIKKIQEESRTSLFICFFCVTALSIIHIIFFLPTWYLPSVILSFLISPVEMTAVCPQPSLPCARLIPSVA